MSEPTAEREIAAAIEWMVRAEGCLHKEMPAAATECLQFTSAHLLKAMRIVTLEKAIISGSPTPVHHHKDWHN